MKALQYWAEKAQLFLPSKPHHLVESIVELHQKMELLTTFSDKEVLEDVPPSNWVKIIPFHLVECPPREHSCSRTHQAYVRGSLSEAHGGGWLGPITAATSQTTAPAQEVIPQWAGASSQHATPHQGSWRSLDPCIGITHQG